MSPLAQEEKAHQFCGMAAGGQRVGISEFARGKTWRNLLAEAGCVEVTDRAGTIGLLLTPDYAEDVSAYIAQLESELEQASCARLVRDEGRLFRAGRRCKAREGSSRGSSMPGRTR
ncbi:MAG: hypothetical protein ACLTDR_15495 [Adlercreutzia equolifaciens]